MLSHPLPVSFLGRWEKNCPSFLAYNRHYWRPILTCPFLGSPFCGPSFTPLGPGNLTLSSDFLFPFSSECRHQKGHLLLHFSGLFGLVFFQKLWKQVLPNEIFGDQKQLLSSTLPGYLGFSEAQKVWLLEILQIMLIHICILQYALYSLKSEGFFWWPWAHSLHLFKTSASALSFRALPGCTLHNAQFKLYLLGHSCSTLDLWWGLHLLLVLG